MDKTNKEVTPKIEKAIKVAECLGLSLTYYDDEDGKRWDLYDNNDELLDVGDDPIEMVKDELDDKISNLNKLKEELL